MADRVGAAGGAAFVLASVIAGPLLPLPPDADASAATIRSWYVDHHDRIVTASLLSVVSALALVLLVAGLRERTSGTARGAVTIGGTLMVAMAVTGGLLQAAAAQAAPRLDGSGATAVFSIERALFFDGPAVTALLLLAGAAVALPVWLGASGCVVGVLALASGIWDLAASNGSPAVLGLPGFLLTVVWVAATSWTLGRENAAPGVSAVPIPA